MLAPLVQYCQQRWMAALPPPHQLKSSACRSPCLRLRWPSDALCLAHSWRPGAPHALTVMVALALPMSSRGRAFSECANHAAAAHRKPADSGKYRHVSSQRRRSREQLIAGLLALEASHRHTEHGSVPQKGEAPSICHVRAQHALAPDAQVPPPPHAALALCCSRAPGCGPIPAAVHGGNPIEERHLEGRTLSGASASRGRNHSDSTLSRKRSLAWFRAGESRSSCRTRARHVARSP